MARTAATLDESAKISRAGITGERRNCQALERTDKEKNRRAMLPLLGAMRRLKIVGLQKHAEEQKLSQEKNELLRREATAAFCGVVGMKQAADTMHMHGATRRGGHQRGRVFIHVALLLLLLLLLLLVCLFGQPHVNVLVNYVPFLVLLGAG